MFNLHTRKRIILFSVLSIIVVGSALTFSIIKIMAEKTGFAVDYPMSAGFTDQKFYNCIATEYLDDNPEAEIPSTGLTDEQLSDIVSLYCPDAGIENTAGIEKLTNLRLLTLTDNLLTTINLSFNANLRYVNLNDNVSLTSINVDGLTNLETLRLSAASLSSINVTSNSALTELNVFANELSSLDVSQNSALEELHAERNDLTSLSLGSNPELRLLMVDGNTNLSNLNVSANTKLEDLRAAECNLSTLTLSNNTALKWLYAENNFLTQIDLSHNPNLTSLWLSQNNLTSLNLSYTPNLKELVVQDNDFSSLDISGNTALESIAADDIFIITGVKGTNTSGNNYSFNFGSFAFLDSGAKPYDRYYGDGTISRQGSYAISNVSGLSYNNSTKVLSTSNLNATAGFAHISLLGVSPFSYDLLLSNHVLTLDPNGAEISPEALVCIPSSGSSCTVILPNTDIAREGYQFLGWADSENATSAQYAKGSSVTLTGKKTIYAIYKAASSFTLSFDFNGGTGTVNSVNCSTFDSSCSVSVPNTTPIRSNYVFLGWADSADKTSATMHSGDKVTLSANVTQYAIWAPVRSLSFDVNGGTGTVATQTCNPTTTNGSCNVTVSNESPTRQNYVFLGWAEAANANAPTKQKGDSITLAANSKLYAIWAPVYKLTFNLNEGSGNIPALSCNPTTTNGSCEVTLPLETPTRENYQFLGWADSANSTTGVIVSENDKLTLDKNTEKYAVWAHGYTLNFNMNVKQETEESALSGNTPTTEPETIESQTCFPTSTDGICSVTIPDIRPKREGYEFFGYNKDAKATNPDFLQGEEYTFTAGEYEETLFSVWADGLVSWLQGQDYILGKDEDMVIRINNPVKTFRSIEIDDEVVDKDNYSVESGSTVITIYARFLDTLSEGTHTLAVNYDYGVKANTTMTITKATTPNTGENTNNGNGSNSFALRLVPLGVIVVGFGLFAVKRKILKVHF